MGERLQDLKQGDDVMCTEVTLAPVQRVGGGLKVRYGIING